MKASAASGDTYVNARPSDLEKSSTYARPEQLQIAQPAPNSCSSSLHFNVVLERSQRDFSTSSAATTSQPNHASFPLARPVLCSVRRLIPQAPSTCLPLVLKLHNRKPSNQQTRKHNVRLHSHQQQQQHHQHAPSPNTTSSTIHRPNSPIQQPNPRLLVPPRSLPSGAQPDSGPHPLLSGHQASRR